MNRSPRLDRVRRRALMAEGRAEPAGPDEENALTMVSCGLPLIGHEIRIVDAGGRELPDRCEGDLQFKGSSATSGYFRNPVQTARLFDGQWLHSGDRAYIAEGEVFITGRSKDIIIRAGRNIYPEELEEAVGRIAGIRQGNVAVFGATRGDSALERIVVLAETRTRSEEGQKSLRQLVGNTVADICGSPPDEVVLAPPNTVLKTSSGKIRRAASRELYEKGAIGRPQRAVWLQMTLFAMAGIRPWLIRLARQLLAAGYAARCWLLFGLTAIVAWPGTLCLPTLAGRKRFLRRAAHLLIKLTGIPLHIENLEHRTKQLGPCILVANHASYLDSLLLTAALPVAPCFIAKAELQRNFASRVFLKRLGTQFVERFDWQKGTRTARALMDRALSGQSLLFFAEGTFTRMPGLLPFRLGAFETAVHTGLPVLPVVIRGSRSILRGDSWFPRRSAVRIIFGPAFPAQGKNRDQAIDLWQAAVTLRDEVRAWMLAHCGEPDLVGERPAIFDRQKTGETPAGDGENPQ